MNKNFFILDDQTRDIIKQTSTLFGVKSEIIKEVFEYLAFTWMLQIAKKPEGLVQLVLPYLGKIGIKFGEESLNNQGELEPDMKVFTVINDTFKEMIKSLRDRDLTQINEYFKVNYIDKLASTITNN
jgi:hypothetical protein